MSVAFSALTLLVGQQEEHLAHKKVNRVMRCWRGYLSGAKCRWSAYGPADVTTTSSLASFKSRMVLPFWCRFTQVLEKRPLNGCSECISCHQKGLVKLWVAKLCCMKIPSPLFLTCNALYLRLTSVIAVKCLLFSASDSDVAHISAVACSSLKKLLSEFPKIFHYPDVNNSLPAENHSSSFIAHLNRGLLHALDNKCYSKHWTKPYTSSSVR